MRDRNLKFMSNRKKRDMKKYEISEQIEGVYKKWKNSIKKCTKEEIMTESRSKLQIFIKNKNQKGNLNIDRIEGMTLK